MNKEKEIGKKLEVPVSCFELEAVKYIAFRYGTTPEQILVDYFHQSGMVLSTGCPKKRHTLAQNEIELRHDLGIIPTNKGTI